MAAWTGAKPSHRRRRSPARPSPVFFSGSVAATEPPREEVSFDRCVFDDYPHGKAGGREPPAEGRMAVSIIREAGLLEAVINMTRGIEHIGADVTARSGEGVEEVVHEFRRQYDERRTSPALRLA